MAFDAAAFDAGSADPVEELDNVTPALANAREIASLTAAFVARCTASRTLGSLFVCAALDAGAAGAPSDADRSLSSCSLALANPRRSVRSDANFARISARRVSDMVK